MGRTCPDRRGRAKDHQPSQRCWRLPEKTGERVWHSCVTTNHAGTMSEASYLQHGSHQRGNVGHRQAHQTIGQSWGPNETTKTEIMFMSAYLYSVSTCWRCFCQINVSFTKSLGQQRRFGFSHVWEMRFDQVLHGHCGKGVEGWWDGAEEKTEIHKICYIPPGYSTGSCHLHWYYSSGTFSKHYSPYSRSVLQFIM